MRHACTTTPAPRTIRRHRLRSWSTAIPGRCCRRRTPTRRAIHEALFADGVLVAIKNVHHKEHCTIKSASNLHVIKAMQSLKSKGYITEQFSWQHYYWTLNDSGIEYLRTYLGLPATVVPKSLQKPATAAKRPAGSAPQRSHEDRSDRDNYRSREAHSGDGKVTDSFQPAFRGGAGRGRGAAPTDA